MQMSGQAISSTAKIKSIDWLDRNIIAIEYNEVLEGVSYIPNWRFYSMWLLENDEICCQHSKNGHFAQKINEIHINTQLSMYHFPKLDIIKIWPIVKNNQEHCLCVQLTYIILYYSHNTSISSSKLAQAHKIFIGRPHYYRCHCILWRLICYTYVHLYSIIAINNIICGSFHVFDCCCHLKLSLIEWNDWSSCGSPPASIHRIISKAIITWMPKIWRG